MPDPDDAALSCQWHDRHGREFRLRPVEPGDIDISRAFIDRLSFGARYFRFGRGDFRYTDDELRRLCRADPAARSHFVVLTCIDGEDAMIGSARYVVQGDAAEFAIAVLDEWQRAGVGRRLMAAVIDSVRRRGLARLYGDVLTSNAAMGRFMERMGFRRAPGGRAGELRTTLELRAQAA